MLNIQNYVTFDKRITIHDLLASGNAVLRASALYSLVDPNMHYDDVDLCDQVQISLRKAKAEAKPQAKLYPNPANESATIVYKVEKDCRAQFVLINMVGQKVMQLSLNEDAGQADFSTQNFLPGVYNYKVICNDFVIDNGKLVVIH